MLRIVMSRFSIFCRKAFFSNAEKFRRVTFSVPEKIWYGKVLGTREGANITISCRFFCLRVPKLL